MRACVLVCVYFYSLLGMTSHVFFPENINDMPAVTISLTNDNDDEHFANLTGTD